MIVYILLLMLVACGVAGGYVSSAKHRELAEGVILGAAFGPFGLLVAVLLPDGEPKADGPTEADDSKHPVERKQGPDSMYLVIPDQFKDIRDS